MIRIAIVGEIGSGKTFVSKFFKYPLFNADKEVTKIYKSNNRCFKKLKKEFPKNITKFPINKSELRNIINKKNIKIISNIVHPYVRLSLRNFLKKNNHKKFVVLDIPLLIENKLNKKSDILVFVRTPNKLIVKRLKKRGNYNKRVIDILKYQQLDKTKKLKSSKFVIDNSFNKVNIIKQINKIKKKINERNSFRY